ncbi:MAG: hypothetical protein M1269_10355 [Chloroflexi bacterium]|nr:hypothetical protein [Chloroflexota bacterium]
MIQRSLWYESEPEKYDKEKLHQDITEQAKNTGGKQTPEQVDRLTENLWSDISLTLKDSRKNRPPTLKIEPKF